MFEQTEKSTVLAVIKTNSPIAIGDISEKAGRMDYAKLREILKTLIEEKEIISIGQKRGTKYCIASFNVEQLSRKTENLDEKILDLLSKNVSSYSMGELEEMLGFDQMAIRSRLKVLMDENKVIMLGSKRWARYCLASVSDQLNTEDGSSQFQNTNFDQFNSAIDLVKEYSSRIPNCGLDMTELVNAIYLFCPKFSKYDLYQSMSPAIKKGYLSYQVIRNYNEQHLKYFKPTEEQQEAQKEQAPAEDNV